LQQRRLICESGHRGPFRGTRCAAKVTPVEQKNRSPYECRGKVALEPELEWCPHCRRGLIVEGYCSFCPTSVRCCVSADGEVRRYAVCAKNPYRLVDHTGTQAAFSVLPLRGYPDAMSATSEPLPHNDPEGHLSSTRSPSKRGPGRPKLTREQQRESLARKRARNAAWMREARRPKREPLP
jgi:hypothetical protein